MKPLFGYVTPYKDELKIREYTIFRAYYCGLCKVLGKRFNQLVRMGLNYDFTFLALLLSSLSQETDTSRAEGCIANPIKKKPVVRPNSYIEYSADMSIMLVYFKLLDDWKDERSLAALAALLVYLLPVKKVKKLYPEKYNSIQSALEKLNELEKQKCHIIDESADAFAGLMQQIFTYPGFDDEKVNRILAWLGYNLGRWIYILDAFHDVEKDIKQNSYNPVLLQYEYKTGEDIEEFKARVKEPLEMSLTFTLDNIAKSFELLDIKHHRSILNNIIYMGVRHRMEQIINKGDKKHEKSIRSFGG